MKIFHLIDYKKYKNYHDNFLHGVYNIKKLYIYHHLFYIN